MEYIETKISNFFKYIKYVENNILNNIIESISRESLLKPLIFCKKITNLIIEKYCEQNEKQFEEILNEVYIILRRIDFGFSNYINGSFFDREKNLKNLKSLCMRNEIYTRELVTSIIDSKQNKFIKNIFTQDNTFLLKIKSQINLAKTAENIYINLERFKDDIYYLKTNDLFGYFYFYRGNEECWYWSPPKKTDPDDIWFICPQIKIDKGFWIDKLLPDYLINFIIWLDIFSPNIPEYTKYKIEEVLNPPKDNYEKLSQNMQKLESQMEKDNCVII
jgi:hypothetical protein